ncbi:unnamed protein product [Brassica rapa subsp. narinosa]
MLVFVLAFSLCWLFTIFDVLIYQLLASFLRFISSRFLTKLLTEDLPRLFVRPKKIVLDFQKGKAVGPISEDLKSGDMQEGNKDYVGELSVTLVNAQKLPYMFSGRMDPYVILRMADQVIRSKKNSQTTVIGAPGQPIWNQDFQFLVSNPREQVLQIEVNDCLGFADMAIGTGQVNHLSFLFFLLVCGWSLFGKGSAGELLLRLTFKAYVEDEEDEKRNAKANVPYASDDEMSDSEEPSSFVKNDKIPSDDPSQRVVYECESSVSPVPSKAGEDSKSQPEDFGSGGISEFEVKNVNSDGGIALLWFGVITSVLVLVAINMAGSSFFNP